jgi:DNA-binding transcriptional LysR family regulator
MLDVKRLVLLRDLAEYGTVTAVAEIHRVTTSAVSQQLRALEVEAGADLLVREGRTVRLTAAGVTLARQSEDVLEALERAQSAVRALDDQVGGELAIGCFPSALASVAAPLVAALADRHPKLRPQITEAEPDEAMPMLKRRDLDLALHYRYQHLGTRLPDGLTAHTLVDDRLILAVPRDRRQEAERDGLRAFRHARWITTPGPSACRDVTLHACHSAGFTPTVEHGYNDLRASLVLVATGHAVTILPEMLCTSPPPGVALIPLPGKKRTIEAVVRAGAEDDPAIAAALAVLRENVTPTA